MERTGGYLDWVSVVVVVTGAGTVVCSVVVVEVWAGWSVSQPVSPKRATVAKLAMISLFIILLVVWLLSYGRRMHPRLVKHHQA